MSYRSVIAIALLIASQSPAAQENAPTSEDLTDTEVRQLLIDNAIRGYPGSCPCPYNRVGDGSRCGSRSAWSIAGGASPTCYDSDVTEAEVKRYRERRAGKVAEDLAVEE